MNKAFIFLLALLVTSSQIVLSQSGVAQTTHYEQYGKPFNKVPDRRDVTMYQVNMRVFSPEGNFAGVTARLDSIKAMGTNVIYLMPHYPVGKLKAVNSPYCIQDYKAVNPEFGSLDDLRTLVAGAHQRGMAVLIDWVANHTSFDHPWTQNKAWYMLDSAGNIIHPPRTNWRDVAQLNFNNAEMRLALIDAMKYWVYAANIDGFRCDYSDGPPVDFWQQTLDSLRNIKTHKLLMMSEGRRSEHYKIGFDYNFGFRFFGGLKGIYERDRSVHLIDSLNNQEYVGADESQRIIRYTSNHDVNGSDGTPLDLFGGKDGSMAAFVVVSYMKSVPMIYGGQEVGTPHRLTFPFTSTKIDWTLNPDLKEEYKRIIKLRNENEAIRRGALKSYNTDDVCAFTKTQGRQKVFVLANLRDKPVTFMVPSELISGKWKEGFSGSKAVLTKEITLQPYAYSVYKN
jgi:glycosidase